MKLRGKLLLVSLSVLILPWAGWQFLRLMADILREGQEQALLAAADAVARGMLQRPAALPPAGPAARIYLERARGGIERLAALVRAMSEATRIEQAIEAAEMKLVDLRTLIADCGDAYRPLLAPRRLDVLVPAAPLPFHGAPDLIVQALDKLIDNARSFCPADGWVCIGLTGDGDEVRIAVANAGPALPERMRDRLFDSLVSVRERGDGAVHLGFGLHIVRLIADLLRGRVEAHDLDDGRGVEFSLLLPVRRA